MQFCFFNVKSESFCIARKRFMRGGALHYAEGCAEMEKACFQMFFRRTVAKYFILQQSPLLYWRMVFLHNSEYKAV